MSFLPFLLFVVFVLKAMLFLHPETPLFFTLLKEGVSYTFANEACQEVLNLDDDDFDDLPALVARFDRFSEDDLEKFLPNLFLACPGPKLPALLELYV